MATSYDVLFLGSSFAIDPTEGNTLSEDAGLLVGNTYGSAGSPLYATSQTLVRVSAVASYQTDNTVSNDQFSVDGTTYTYDGMAVYGATITYVDGTSTTVEAKISQTTTGELFLVPHMAGAEFQQYLLEAQPLQSITLTSLISSDSLMGADRLPATYPDGVVDGTTSADVMKAGSTDADGDAIDAGANSIVGGDGADYIEAAGGNDTVTGDGGNDTIFGDMADGSVYGSLNPTNTDNIQDASSTEVLNTRAVELVTLANGDLLLITSERAGADDGIASYFVDNDLASSTYGQVIGGRVDFVQDGTVASGYDDIEDLAAITLSNDCTFVYSADEVNGSIGVTTVNMDGSLTPLTTITGLPEVQELSISEVDGSPYLLALTGGTDDSLIAYKINGDGTLTQTDVEVDGTGAGENYLNNGDGVAPSLLESFTNSSGETFVIAGGAENGISLWTLDGSGLLTFQNARGDDQAGASDTDPQGNSLGRDLISPSMTGLSSVDAGTFAEIAGETYLFAGGYDDDVVVFRVDADTVNNDGTYDLTLVGELIDPVPDISAMSYLETDDGGVLVLGGEQQGLEYHSVTVNGDGTVTLTQVATSADGPEGSAELMDSEAIDVEGGILVSASDNDDGVALIATGLNDTGAAGVAGADSLSGGAGDDFIVGDGLTATTNEMLTNGDFASGASGWTINDPTGNGGVAPDIGAISFNSGDETVYGDSIQQTFATAAGSPYQVSYSLQEFQSGNADHTFRVDILDADGTVIATQTSTIYNNTGDTFTFDFVANSAASTIVITNTTSTSSNSSDGILDNVSVVELGDADVGGPDTINGDAGSDTLMGGAGDDYIYGGTDDDLITGGSGNNTLQGDAGNDTVIGGDDADSIIANDGHDLVYGGAGNDTIDDVPGSADGTGSDTFYGQAGDDEIYGGNEGDLLDGGTGNDFIIGEDGNDTIVGGDGFDTIYGDNADETGDDLIYGDAGNDQIYGYSGADTLYGGAGSDTITGGSGADYISGDTSAVALNTSTTDGYASIDNFAAMPTTEVSYEITFSSTTPGSGSTPLLSYASDGSNTNALLFQINGDTVELLVNSSAPVALDIDATALFDGAPHTLGFTWDSATGQINFYSDGELAGSATGPTSTIAAGGTFLLGQEQDAMGGGFDTTQLFSGEVYEASLWNDVRNPSEMSADTASTYTDESDVNLVAHWVADPEANAFTDTVAGNNLTLAGDASVVQPGSGDDRISGGTEADTIFGGFGDDTIVLENGFGNDVVTGGEDPDGTDIDVLDGTAITNGGISVTFTGSEAGTFTVGTDTVTFSEIESIVLSNNADTVDGSAATDPLIVNGLDGDDSLSGGTGADTIAGGAGDDTVRGGAGADSLTGGTGNDWLDYSGSGGFTADLGTNTVFGSHADGDTISGFTNIIGSDFGDTLTLSDTSGQVNAGGGNDFAEGGAGDDTLLGEAGSDTLFGNDGDDSLSGGADADSLVGGLGSDTLDGGNGADTLTGGAGADTFIADGTPDLITDFDTTTGIGDVDQTNNDFVDLSAYYNPTTLAEWNAANPGQTYDSPLSWMRADQADGVLDGAGRLTIQNGGSAVAANELTAENTNVICFVAGTPISTINGEVAVEELRVGDKVLTLDNGYRKIRWIGRRKVAGHGRLAPVLIRTAVLNNSRDLMVSQQHRMFLSSKISQRVVGDSEILVSAKHLLGCDGIVLRPVPVVEYVHFLFDNHELVFSSGAVSESLFTGPEALKAVDPFAKEEILHLFPELEYRDYVPRSARHLAKGQDGRRIADRHRKNGRPLLF